MASFIFCLFTVLCMQFFCFAEGVINIKISGIKGTAGRVLYAVHNSSVVFPDGHEKAFVKGEAKTSGGTAEVMLKNIPQGEYAISVLHDMNGNNKMDYNWIGMPKEGHGFSGVYGNSRFFKPDFVQSKFSVGSEPINFEIKMKY